MSLYSNVRAAVRTNLMAVSGFPADDLRAWEGWDFTPQPGTTWVRDTILPLSAERVSVGPVARVRHTAIYQIDVFTPALKGTAGDVLADAIVVAFWPGLQLSYGGQLVTVRRASRSPAFQADGWRQLPISVTVEMDAYNPA